MIGTGHLMRCLTLASALQEEGATCIFICRAHSTSLTDLVRKQGFTLYELPQGTEPLTSDCLGVAKLQDAEETKNIIQSLPEVPDWLIVDHYGIDKEWEQKLRPFVKRIFVIDDLANRPHDCDVLLDQNYTHNWNRYEGLVPEHCRLFLGPEYALLRSEFINARRKLEEQGWPPFDPRKVFVFFGGMDPQNYTGQALRVLRKIGDFAPEVVIGSGNVYRAEIEHEMQFFPEGQLHVQTDQMAEIMLRCSWYLGSGGSITWERMCLGLTGIVVPIVENQIPASSALANDNLHISIKSFQDISEDILHKFFVQIPDVKIQNMNLVNTYGLDKIILGIFREINLDNLTIRDVTEEDIFTLFLWANDAKVRNNAFNNKWISIVDHKQWFFEKLNNLSTKIYILEYEHLPVGQIRFDLCEGIWLLDYSISSFLRGYKISPILLKKGEEALKKTIKNSIQIRAKVKRSNIASLISLRKNGYTEVEKDSTFDYISLQK